MPEGHFNEFEEEYLETIYKFWELDKDCSVRTGELAKEMGVSPASVTEMIQRLSRKGMLDYVPYKGVKLTDEGFSYGRKMKRRHRLLECFLIDVLAYQGDAHEAACMMEHAVTDELEIILSQILDNPKIDPSGRDIPPPNSEISMSNISSKLILLTNLDDEESGEVFAIILSGSDKEIIAEFAIKIGVTISRKDGDFIIEGKQVDLHSDLQNKIVLHKG